jgi:hypothetical protein
LILGRYLGPATDIGSALTASTKWQFVCRSTLRHLTDKELQSSVHLDKRRQFDESVATHLGPASTVQDFPAKNLTPDPDHYDDTDPIDPDHGDAETTPEMGDNYLSAKIMVEAQWSKDALPRKSVSGMATQLGSPIQTLS